MKQQKLRKLAFVVAIVAFLFVFKEEARATSSTADKIKELEQSKKDTESKLNEAESKKDQLEDTKGKLEGLLSELSSDLKEISENLELLEKELNIKEEEIAVTKKELEEAKVRQENQYSLIKQRIRYVYERGETSYLEAFFSAGSYAEFLNKADYVTKVNDFDQKMLERYIQRKKEVVAKEEKLQEELIEVTEIRDKVDGQKNELKSRVSATSGNIQSYKGQISAAEQDALAYEASINQQEEDLDAWKKKYAEEQEIARRAAAAAKRNISDIQISASDEDLMAAIIECEAGGESYEGKIAVGAVVMNRVMSSVFPDTIPGVIYQNKQFSPVASGRLSIVLARGASASCRQAAQESMAGANNVGACLFFRTIRPEINGLIIGNHVFY